LLVEATVSYLEKSEAGMLVASSAVLTAIQKSSLSVVTMVLLKAVSKVAMMDETMVELTDAMTGERMVG
jgi:hypothetical protein